MKHIKFTSSAGTFTLDTSCKELQGAPIEDWSHGIEPRILRERTASTNRRRARRHAVSSESDLQTGPASPPLSPPPPYIQNLPIAAPPPAQRRVSFLYPNPPPYTGPLIAHSPPPPPYTERAPPPYSPPPPYSESRAPQSVYASVFSPPSSPNIIRQQPPVSPGTRSLVSSMAPGSQPNNRAPFQDRRRG